MVIELLNMNHLPIKLCHLLDNHGQGLCFQLALENGQIAANMRGANNDEQNTNTSIQAFEQQLRRSTRIDLKTMIPIIADRIWSMKENYDRSKLTPHTGTLLDDFLEEVCSL
jgi:hypothetical protein